MSKPRKQPPDGSADQPRDSFALARVRSSRADKLARRNPPVLRPGESWRDSWRDSYAPVTNVFDPWEMPSNTISPVRGPRGGLVWAVQNWGDARLVREQNPFRRSAVWTIVGIRVRSGVASARRLHHDREPCPGHGHACSGRRRLRLLLPDRPDRAERTRPNIGIAV